LADDRTDDPRLRRMTDVPLDSRSKNDDFR
jgi:hypothetical protein